MEKKIFWMLVLTALFLLACSSMAYAELTPPLPGAPSYINIDVEKAHEMLEENPEQIILLDVRTKEDYNAGYIPGAVNIPLPDLENRMADLDKSKTIIVHCQSGDRSKTASDTLAQHGFIVYNMLGGINAWKDKFATSTSTPVPTTTATTATATATTATLTLIPTRTSEVTPSPVVSPVVTPAASPTPAFVPTLTPTESLEEEKGVPGFEAHFAITMLLILFVLLRKK